MVVPGWLLGGLALAMPEVLTAPLAELFGATFTIIEAGARGTLRSLEVLV
jgi:hypothetical protein